jgi:hypothetical protein
LKTPGGKNFSILYRSTGISFSKFYIISTMISLAHSYL